MSETFDLELTGIAHGGTSLGKHAGRVIFVPYTIPGEVIRASVTEDKKRFANARAESILTPSLDRVEPVCPYFGPGRCGGCHFQHIDYERQLELKYEVVLDQFKRIGKFEHPPLEAIIANPSPWEYRSHATFTPLPDGSLGFHADDGASLVPVQDCFIIQPELRDLLKQLDFEAGEINRIKFQVGSDPDDMMLIIQTPDDMAPEITVDFPVSINLLLSDNEPVNLIGNTNVVYHVFEREFRVTAGAFSQVNAEMMEMLVDLVITALDLKGHETVLDLYSGVGLFTAFIAEFAETVVSVESYPPAVTDAEVNLSDFDNVDIVEGSADLVLQDLSGPFDAIVVDPPRAGLTNEVIDQLAELKAHKLVYVSCDPATLARDSQKLVRHGYTLVSIQPVDLFPQTYHIEAVAVFAQL